MDLPYHLPLQIFDAVELGLRAGRRRPARRRVADEVLDQTPERLLVVLAPGDRRIVDALDVGEAGIARLTREPLAALALNVDAARVRVAVIAPASTYTRRE
jgi:hypothetical protein